MLPWLPSVPVSVPQAGDRVGTRGADRSSDLTERLQLVQVLVVFGSRDHVDLEDHARVVEAAQLRTPTGERAFAGRSHVELVERLLARHDVELEVELRNP